MVILLLDLNFRYLGKEAGLRQATIWGKSGLWAGPPEWAACGAVAERLKAAVC